MITVVEKLLSERFEGKVRLDAVEEIRSSGRSKVSRYPVEYGHLKSVGATVRTIAEKLRAQWPAEADAMPYYPAFRTM